MYESPVKYLTLRVDYTKRDKVEHINDHMERRKNRCKSNPDVDPSRTHLNFHIIEPDGPYIDFIERRVRETGARVNVRSNLLVGFLISVSPSWTEDRDDDEIYDFFSSATDFISHYFEKDNIVSAVVHMDEETPHMHVEIVPVTPHNRINSTDVFRERMPFPVLHDFFFIYMHERYPDISRPIPAWITGADHLHTELYKKKMNVLNDYDYISDILIKARRSYFHESNENSVTFERTKAVLAPLADYAYELPNIWNRVRMNGYQICRVSEYLEIRKDILNEMDRLGMAVFPNRTQLLDRINLLILENMKYKIISDEIRKMDPDLKKILFEEILAPKNESLQGRTAEEILDVIYFDIPENYLRQLPEETFRYRAGSQKYIFIDRSGKETARFLKAQVRNYYPERQRPEWTYLVARYDSDRDKDEIVFRGGSVHEYSEVYEMPRPYPFSHAGVDPYFLQSELLPKRQNQRQRDGYER